MGRCWAKCLGNCSGKISGEHIITKGLFDGKSIGVRGLPWCREEHKFISKDAYTANILCRKHNSDLSPVDDAAIHAMNTFRTVMKVHQQRKVLLEERLWAGRFDLHEYTISGDGLERWLLKTLINMEMVGGQGLPIGAPGGKHREPPCELVGVALGLRRFENREGLYLAAVEGQAVQTAERVHYVSLIKESSQGNFVAAGEFLFYGMRFFLCLEPDGLPRAIRTDDGELKLLHHVAGINVELNGLPSQRIMFTWAHEGSAHTLENAVTPSATQD